MYWTITRLFRGLSSLIGNLSDLDLTIDLQQERQKTSDYILLILVLILSEVICVFSVLDFGFMGIFIFSEEESEVTTPILKNTESSDFDKESKSFTSISTLNNEATIINLSEITEGEEIQGRKNGLGKLFKSVFKDCPVLFRKISLPRLSGYVVEELTLEIEAQRKLNFSRVLPILGIVIELPVIGFLTPVLVKGSLYNTVHVEKTSFNLTEKIRIASEIAAGILNFHSQGKVHGHLTSHNILFDDNITPYISDLGFNKVKKYAGIVSGYTNIGS